MSFFGWFFNNMVEIVVRISVIEVGMTIPSAFDFLNFLQ